MNNTERLNKVIYDLEVIGDFVAADAAIRSLSNPSDVAVAFHESILRIKNRQLQEFGRIYKSFRKAA